MAHLTLEFDGDDCFEFAMLNTNAPRNTAGVSVFLSKPRTTRALHVMYDGPAMMLAFEPDESMQDLIASMPLENATCYPEAGEAFWFRFPARTFARQEREIWEIAVAYAPGVRLFSQLGWTPASVFARTDASRIEALAAVGRSLRADGARSVKASLGSP